uniref:NADH-ubiquinone oxidoreductase chain 2 n=1 Tax=Hycleus phaleratus TaxID=1248972 RepID=A0A343A7D7_9CUCU|nr:NADH dehydrogenase subunit 2 [Hycleus phaleratus]APB02791.1 NADH dehydrogenase subunit 2 [Hycleus phaleratus]ATP06055.1 NADH dehydrogenase subunit 2 [Hycleus phaleratus]
MLKFYKIVFFNSMILGTLIAISSYSWFGMWMGLEINLLSIIPLFNSTKNMYSSEASLKYFLTQAMASLILLLSLILMMISTELVSPQMSLAKETLLNSALLTKLGAAPFHYWFPEVMEGLNWMNCMILLTWQKIAPMCILIMSNPNTSFMIIIILASLIVSTIMSFNQISLRKIMAYSSINHIAWMLSAMLISTSIWFIYLLIYLIITINITSIFTHGKLMFINQLAFFMNQNKINKISLMINFLSLGGLPPFLGFLPKWFTINWMIIENFPILAFLLIILTLIMLFVYVRLILSSLIIQSSESKIPSKKLSSFLIYLINFISLSSLFSCTFLFNFI